MFRRRPPELPALVEAGQSDIPDKAEGFCFRARQQDLHFGSNRREPVATRPVVSLARRGRWRSALPATTRPNPRFFRVTADQPFRKWQPTDPRDSYLCPRYETLPDERLRKVGLVPQPVRVDIARWLRRHWREG